MLSSNQIKRLNSLHIKKYRQKENEILLEGHRLIYQALMAKAQIERVWATENYVKSKLGKVLSQLLNKKNIIMEIGSEKSIQRICDGKNSQGIIAVLQPPKYGPLKKIPNRSLYLDDITDPGNMGTILRTTAWFGIDSIFMSAGCVDVFNSKVLRSAAGAHFYFQQLHTLSLDEMLNISKDLNLSVIGADINGESLDDLSNNIQNGWILILGNEAHGISPSIQSRLTHRVSIPGYGDMESLNVAVAGGILLQSLTCKKSVTN